MVLSYIHSLFFLQQVKLSGTNMICVFIQRNLNAVPDTPISTLNYTFETQLVQDMAAVKPTAILSATSAASLLDNAPAFTGDSFLHYMDEPIAQK